jgi:hypothetical protein
MFRRSSNKSNSLKKINESNVNEEENVIIKKIEIDMQPEEIDIKEQKEQESEEEQILNSVMTRLNEI